MSAEHCAHRFERIGWTRTEGRFRRLWSCVFCGFWTRTYDSIDRTMTRPIHPHMTVAAPGFNTVERDGDAPAECCRSGRCEVCDPTFDWGRDG